MKRACQQVGACLHPLYIALSLVVMYSAAEIISVYLDANKCVEKIAKTRIPVLTFPPTYSVRVSNAFSAVIGKRFLLIGLLE
jgi:hypothetical protein